MATGAGQPGSLHLYTVAAQGEQMTRVTYCHVTCDHAAVSGGEVTCVTCSVLTSRGDTCGDNSVDMNWAASHYVHTCRGQVIT